MHSICEDSARLLLIGGRGLLILHGQDATYYSSNESQADNSIRTIRQTADGAIWIGTISGLRKLDQGVGTQGGLLRLSPSAASTITTADGAPQSINTIYQDPGGRDSLGDLFVTALNGHEHSAGQIRLSGKPVIPHDLSAAQLPFDQPQFTSH